MGDACRAYFSSGQADSEGAGSTTLQDQLFPSLGGAASQARRSPRASTCVPDLLHAASLPQMPCQSRIITVCPSWHSCLAPFARQMNLTSRLLRRGQTRAQLLRQVQFCVLTMRVNIQCLQGVDAEGASPSSAAAGLQLQGVWGSGSIASRLAQVQKGERPASMLSCRPGTLHARHWSQVSFARMRH